MFPCRPALGFVSEPFTEEFPDTIDIPIEEAINRSALHLCVKVIEERLTIQHWRVLCLSFVGNRSRPVVRLYV